MSDGPNITVSRQGGDWSRVLGDSDNIVENAARAAWRAAATDGTLARDCEISIALADDALVRALNRDYRGIDRATNVLSFPAGDPGAPGRPWLIGDAVLALETVEAEASEAGRPVVDHVTHLVVHGVLHLLGYDHETEADAAVMETLEIDILAGLDIENPYILMEQPAG